MKKGSFLRRSVLMTMMSFVFFGSLSNLWRTVNWGWEKTGRKFLGE